MRIYSSVLEAVKETERELFEMGVDNHSKTVQDQDISENPDYDSKELLGYGYMITGFEDRDRIFDFFFEDPIEGQEIKDYVIEELSERLSAFPLNPGNSWEYRRSYWEQFLSPHTRKFSYTYSERIWYQVPLVIDRLREDPGTRQALITIYDSCKDVQNWGGRARIPCSIYYQFLRRKIGGTDKLLLIYTMRSCDFYTHFPIDVWLAIRLGQQVAKLLKIELYSFTHFLGSLHAFQKDFGRRRIF